MTDVPVIELYRGATTLLEIDLEDTDFDGGTVVFTIKKIGSNEIVYEWTFEEPGRYPVTVTDESTANLDLGARYWYDVMRHKDDERYPLTKPTIVRVNETVGGYME